LYRDGGNSYGLWARESTDDFGLRLNDVNGNDVRAFGINTTSFEEWTMITAVVDRARDEVRLYENDSLATTVSATELGDIDDSGRFAIGGRPWDEQNAPVAVDQLRIFTSALDADRIEALHNRADSTE
jgi:hypothetical protein